MNRIGLPVVLLVLLPLLVAVSVLVMTRFPVAWLAGILSVMALAAWLIVYLRWQPGFMKLFALLLPFSVEIPISGDSMMLLPSEPMLVLAALMLVIELLRKPASLPTIWRNEIWWLLPFALAFVLTLPFTAMGTVSLKYSIVNLLYMAVFFVYLSLLPLRHPALLKQLFLLYAVGFLLVAVWSVYQYWQLGWNPIVVRGIFSPFFKDHTIFGASAALLAMWWAAGSMAERSRLSGFFVLITALLYFLLVMLSGSRAAFLSLFFALFVLLLLQLRIKVRYLMMGGLVMLTVLLLNRDHIIQRLEQVSAVSYDAHAGLIDRTQSVGNITTDISNLERLNRWVAAWRMFLEKPVTGFGPGTYQFTYIPFQASEFRNRLTVTNPYDVPENSGGTAHSEYLLAMSEMGLAGLIGWLVLIGRWSYIAFRHPRTHPGRKQILIAFTALSTYLFHAFFNNFLNTDKFAFLFWGMAVWLTIHYNTTDERAVLQDS
jgi:putative inorganic carbon (hco3(-)) transporter